MCDPRVILYDTCPISIGSQQAQYINHSLHSPQLKNKEYIEGKSFRMSITGPRASLFSVFYLQMG